MALTPVSVRPAPVTRMFSPSNVESAWLRVPWTEGACGWICHPLNEAPLYDKVILNRIRIIDEIQN